MRMNPEERLTYNLLIKESKRNPIKQRAGNFNLETAWPFGSISPVFGGIEGLPTIRRCLSVYATALNIVDLETENEKPHYFIDLLERPHPAFSKSDFYEALVWETLVNGQFICKVKYDRVTGKIKELIPFRNNSARAYAVKGDYDDAESLSTNGFYYRSNYTGKVFWPDEALHVKDNLQARGDMLNGYPRSFYYKTLFDFGCGVLNASKGLAYSGGRGAVLIEGLPMDSAQTSESIRKRFENLLQSGLDSSTKQVMGMPSGYKAQRLMAEQGHSIMAWLAERSDLEIAKIFDVPYEILQVGKIGSQSLKEVYRQFIRTSLRNFLYKVQQAFNHSVGDGTKFIFRIGKMRFSDAREAGTYYSALIQDGVLSPEEVKKELEE